MEIYILVIEMSQEENGVVFYLKSAVILMRKMCC